MTHPLMSETVWFDRWRASDAERSYHEKLASQHAGLVVQETSGCQGQGGVNVKGGSSLVNEIARARQHIQQSLQTEGTGLAVGVGIDTSLIAGRLDRLEEENTLLRRETQSLQTLVSKLEARVSALESKGQGSQSQTPQTVAPPTNEEISQDEEDDDDDIDLFGSDDEADKEAEKLKQQRLAEYASKKAKKPGPIAKSNVILDIKPWDDETDMAQVEQVVRTIKMDGLMFGTSKLVPVGYGIKKLQISCVVEDEKVSIEDLEERIQEFEDVQSTDVAAFNKI